MLTILARSRLPFEPSACHAPAKWAFPGNQVLRPRALREGPDAPSYAMKPAGYEAATAAASSR